MLISFILNLSIKIFNLKEGAEIELALLVVEGGQGKITGAKRGEVTTPLLKGTGDCCVGVIANFCLFIHLSTKYVLKIGPRL